MTRLARLTGRPYQSPARLSAAPGGHADAQLREVVALGVGGVDEVERELEHRVGVGADEHGGVADRLDQAHVAAQALGGELDQAMGDAAELVGRDLLAQAREADEVGEARP